MTSSKAYADYILHDVLGHIPDITRKRMFWGYGFYLGWVIFACIVEDELYLKALGEDAQELKSMWSVQFVYDGHKTKWSVSMPYWKVPIEILEDGEKMEVWAHRAFHAHKR